MSASVTTTAASTEEEADTKTPTFDSLRVIVKATTGHVEFNFDQKLADKYTTFKPDGKPDFPFDKLAPEPLRILAAKLYEITGVTYDNLCGISMRNYQLGYFIGDAFDPMPIAEKGLELLAEHFGLRRDQLLVEGLENTKRPSWVVTEPVSSKGSWFANFFKGKSSKK